MVFYVFDGLCWGNGVCSYVNFANGNDNIYHLVYVSLAMRGGCEGGILLCGHMWFVWCLGRCMIRVTCHYQSGSSVVTTLMDYSSVLRHILWQRPQSIMSMGAKSNTLPRKKPTHSSPCSLSNQNLNHHCGRFHCKKIWINTLTISLK
jgi:hypothetical protein